MYINTYTYVCIMCVYAKRTHANASYINTYVRLHRPLYVYTDTHIHYI